MNHATLTFERALVEKYDRPGPRYTSYPTAPRFHSDFTLDEYRDAVGQSNGDLLPKPLSLYVHIPFCHQLCYYCACHKIVTHRPERAADYLAYLKREIRLQAYLFDDDRQVTQLHLGGGTPTYLTGDQLGELMAALDDAFCLDWRESREFSIEVDPRSVSVATIGVLKAQGFNRLSLGVQDFDPRVQQAVNRVQSEAQVTELLSAARHAGFASVSFDLIYGLPCQTASSFSRTLDKVIALRPDRIATYAYAHLPETFRAQRLIQSSDMPTPEQKLELLALIIDRLQAAGYVYIGMDHFALPEDELVRARGAGTLQRNFQGYSTQADCDLIGLGISAIGKVADTYSQNAKSLPEYYRRLDELQLPVVRGYRLSDDDRLRRDVIHHLMCHGVVDIPAIEQRYAIDFRTYFAESLRQLEAPMADGLVTLDEASLILQLRGRLVMRNIAMAFDAYLDDDSQQRPFSRTV
ncbi:oxygen-independent coproporphyrinogen III oxidase [Aidingimonas lacisalsi]|uniref:oxygen-independent coproporphyrinogen III oxidase n=1 Tax=Aidingimonas lacisalsi TaxID=2604086 RepID=UPI0011D23159|nr:oxygen-independent coproporphyrinogen III oxidase [Aidingimonas lacisalsi]